MEEKEVILTQEGYDKIEKELEFLRTEKRTEIAERIKVALGFGDLSENSEYDEAGSIGKRYRREDEIGTPYCVTVDFDTLNDNSVTIRDRDTMEQVRVNIDELENWISEKVEF